MLVCGPFHSTNNPLVGMAYLRSYLEARGIECRTRDLNIESRGFLLGATGDADLIRKLYSQSTRRYLAEAMIWSWLHPEGPAGIIRRTRAHPSRELRRFWEEEGIDRLEDDVRIRHASALLRRWLEQRAEEIAAGCRGWVGLATAITSLAANLFLARRLKELDAEFFVVIGGPEVTDRNAAELLHSFPFLDAAIPAPAYEPLAALASNPKRARTMPLPAGVWRRNDGGGVECDSRKCWTDLDSIPPANWTDFEMGQYDTGFILRDNPERMRRWYPTIPLHTTQGCSYNLCDFCYNTSLYSSFATRTPTLVATEIDHQIRTMSSRGFFFTDFEFNAIPPRAAEICRLIAELPDEIRFYAWLRLDKTDRKFLECLYASGARQIFIGVEAVDDGLLALMRKGYSSALAMERLQVLYDFVQEFPDFRYEFNLITNYPGETLDSVRRTLTQIAENPHLFSGHVAAVVEFMLHEGSPAYCSRGQQAVGCMETLLPPGARVRSYRNLLPDAGDAAAEERLEIWSAIRSLLEHKPGHTAPLASEHPAH